MILQTRIELQRTDRLPTDTPTFTVFFFAPIHFALINVTRINYLGIRTGSTGAVSG